MIGLKKLNTPRVWIWLSASLWAILISLCFVKIVRDPNPNDFHVYYRTSERILSGHLSQVYQLSDSVGMFRYPPLVLPMFAPIALVPEALGKVIFYLASVLAAGLGFWLLGLCLSLKGQRAWGKFWLGSLLTARFFWDGFINGQVVALMFLGLSLTLYGLCKKRAALSGLGLLVPVSLKLGMLGLAPLFLFQGLRFSLRASGAAVLACLALLGLCVFLPGVHLLDLGGMMASWLATLDSVISPTSEHYVLCNDFRSQCVNSALLRLSLMGFLSVEQAYEIWSAIGKFALITVAVVFSLAWILRKGRVLSATEWLGLWSFGLLSHLLFMPWAYRHTFAFLAFPLALLLNQKLAPWELWVVVGVALTMSFAGPFPLGLKAAGWIQDWSIPVFTMFALMAAVLSRISPLLRRPTSL